LRKDAMIEKLGLSYANCRDRFETCSQIDRMFTRDTMDTYPGYNSDRPDESSSPIIYAPESIDPDDEQALSKWFAWWALTKLDLHRKFTIVGTGPNSENPVTRKRRITEIPTYTTSTGVSASTQKMKALEVAKKLTAFGPVLPPVQVDMGKLSNSKSPLARHISDEPRSSSASAPDDPDVEMDMDIISDKEGGLPVTAKQANNDTQLAVQLDTSGDSRTRLDPDGDIDDRMDIDAQVKDSAANTRSPERQQIPHLATRDIERAMEPCSSPVVQSPAVASVRKNSYLGSHSPWYNKPSPVESPVKDKAEPSSTDGSRRSSANANDEGKSEVVIKEIVFEPTTEWYGRMKKKGEVWEHLLVDSWEKCFKHLGFK
jgi:hypothetical protein